MHHRVRYHRWTDRRTDTGRQQSPRLRIASRGKNCAPRPRLTGLRYGVTWYASRRLNLIPHISFGFPLPVFSIQYATFTAIVNNKERFLLTLTLIYSLICPCFENLRRFGQNGPKGTYPPSKHILGALKEPKSTRGYYFTISPPSLFSAATV